MALGEPSTSGRPAQLDQISTSGDGCVFYPSGNIAVVVCKQEAGHIITFFSDSKDSQVGGYLAWLDPSLCNACTHGVPRKEADEAATGRHVHLQVLASFDNLGIGGVNYGSGRPWYVPEPSLLACDGTIANPTAGRLGACALPATRESHIRMHKQGCSRAAGACAWLRARACRLVVTPDGYSVSSRKGDIVERGKWPRKSEEPIT